LTTLDLSYAPVTPDQFLPFIAQCRNLETLWVLRSLGIALFPSPARFSL
jgi:hypothetical protein